MPNRGPLAVIAIFAIAAAASLAAIAYLRHQSRRATEHWGTEASELILNAPQVMLGRVRREKAYDADDAAEIWSIVGEKDVTFARGFINVRRGLMIDASFDWNSPPPSEAVDWEHALTFRARPDNPEAASAVILLAPKRKLAAKYAANEPPKTVGTTPINDGVVQFVAEQSLPE